MSTERLPTRLETVLHWDTHQPRGDLLELYRKGARDQWNADTDVDWSISVDPEAENTPDATIPIYGSDLWARLSPREVRRFRRENMAWLLSQFLHGEQGALVTTAQIVATTPDMDAKLYGSTQVMDEGRHVAVFERYLRDKIGLQYPVDQNLRQLLASILTDARWDLKYLGMQVLVEGLALGAFATIEQFTAEPLLRQIIRLVMRDEARHVAFGVLSLRDHYRELSDGERRDRAQAALDACRIMYERFVAREVFAEMGLPVERCVELALSSPVMAAFRRTLFSRVVPNLRRLGLLLPEVRPEYERMGILAYEHGEPAA
jgi:hypothetical protein